MTKEIDRLLDIMALLRDPDKGCPWDVEQTFATIVPHTIEEAYEVADAVDQGDMKALEDELGDLLLQVVFHAQMAREDGLFDFEAVARAINDKLVRRHPHVFGDAVVETAEAQTAAWEDTKAREREAKAETSVLDGVARGLPALLRAHKLQKRAARVGFDWGDATGVLDKVREEAAEITTEISGEDDPDRVFDEVGDLLFTCVNLARKLDVDPEAALRHASNKFEKRFRRMEATLAADGKAADESSLEVMDAAWEKVKAEGDG